MKLAYYCNMNVPFFVVYSDPGKQEHQRSGNVNDDITYTHTGRNIFRQYILLLQSNCKQNVGNK